MAPHDPITQIARTGEVTQFHEWFREKQDTLSGAAPLTAQRRGSLQLNIYFVTVSFRQQNSLP